MFKAVSQQKPLVVIPETCIDKSTVPDGIQSEIICPICLEYVQSTGF